MSRVVPAELAVLAAALRAAEASRVPIPPIAAAHPELTVDDAYLIQQLNMRLRVEAGERIAGHKVGLTSLAMQQQLGVDQPDFGVITDRMVIRSGGAVVASEMLAPRAEAEFAFRIGAELPPSPTLEELTGAIDGVGVAVEIIDSRIADWKITLVDTVADNASSARIVVGSMAPVSRDLLAALPGTTIELRKDGAQLSAGPGAAVLGDPLVSLHWLAEAIGARGDHFSAGDIVLAGAVAAAVPLTSGSEWEVAADGFEPVRFRSISSQDAS